MALPLTLAGPLPTSAAASANSTASAGLVPPGPATVLHTSPTPWSVPNHLDGVFCADTRVCQEVYYQAIQSYGPIELGLAENVEALDFAINHASGDKVAYGFSGGARVVSAWLERQAESNSVSPDDTNIVLLGNSGRKYGGINGFFWGNLFNILMTPTDTDYNVLDVARQFDPIADFPDNPFNLLALANAVAAFTNTHLT
ncbi:MAG: PE-PPE domain-containing protein, partial [Mycobacterium sp.]